MSAKSGGGELDVVVIGAGPGGYVAAIHGAQRGLKVAIVERDTRRGGTCLLRGCIPTKALLESASLYDKLKHAGQFGIKVDGFAVDFAGVQAYKADIVDQNARGVDFLLKKYGVTLVEGTGRLTGRGKVEVTGRDGSKQTLATRNVVIATGSRVADLPVAPRDGQVIVNSDDLLEIDRVPEHLIVMGAGAVGSEFASVFVRFGSKVDLIELMPNILPLEDEEISKTVERSFKKQGMNVLTGTRVQKVERTGERAVRVEVERPGGKRETLTGDMLLVAVGRAPVTENLGLEALGVRLDKRGRIEVDARCRTGVEGIYAIGDVIATPWLAHVASHEGTMVMDQIAGLEAHPLNYDQVPNCTYCHPEVASVGLTEKAARERGYDVKVATVPFKAIGKAKIARETDGLIKFVAEKRYDELLGVHIVGHHATELIAESAAALRLETTTEEMMHTIHPHPTLSEIVGEVAHAAALGQPLHF